MWSQLWVPAPRGSVMQPSLLYLIEPVKPQAIPLPLILRVLNGFAVAASGPRYARHCTMKLRAGLVALGVQLPLSCLSLFSASVVAHHGYDRGHAPLLPRGLGDEEEGEGSVIKQHSHPNLLDHSRFSIPHEQRPTAPELPPRYQNYHDVHGQSPYTSDQGLSHNQHGSELPHSMRTMHENIAHGERNKYSDVHQDTLGLQKHLHPGDDHDLAHHKGLSESHEEQYGHTANPHQEGLQPERDYRRAKDAEGTSRREHLSRTSSLMRLKEEHAGKSEERTEKLHPSMHLRRRHLTRRASGAHLIPRGHDDEHGDNGFGREHNPFSVSSRWNQFCS